MGFLEYWQSEKRFYKDKDTRDAWLCEEEGRLPLIRFHSLDAHDWLEAACSTRKGGVSTGFVGELNLAFGVGDVPENVPRNYARAARSMGFFPENLCLTQQVHETNLLAVDESLKVGKDFVRKIFRTDGLITGCPGLLLSATFADCVPLLLADPVTRQVAAVHSGWKGTVGKIGEKAVRALAERGARPGDMTAVIGPCISQPHYEVTGDVAHAMEAVFRTEETEDILLRTDELHWLCDLPAACWHTLRGAGIPGDSIHFSGLCTWENPEWLFSHRRSHGKRGNFNTFIGIKEV